MKYKIKLIIAILSLSLVGCTVDSYDLKNCTYRTVKVDKITVTGSSSNFLNFHTEDGEIFKSSEDEINVKDFTVRIAKCDSYLKDSTLYTGEYTTIKFFQGK